MHPLRIAAAVGALVLMGHHMTQAQTLPAPGFHHLQLKSTDPEAAIDFYVAHFPSASRTTWGGKPALRSKTNVLILFDKVATKPTIEPQSAIWHFGWHVTNLREAHAKARGAGATMMPMHTGDGDRMVEISADTWRGPGGVIGSTAKDIADFKSKGIAPGGLPNGFGYIRGPDDAMIEIQGAQPVERMNHIHMWQDEVFCAQLWYRKHLNAAPVQGRAPATPITEENCKAPRDPERSWPAFDPRGMFRAPTAAVLFDDVMFTWYANQGAEPLAPSRGQLYDHIGLSVRDLDAWIAKLRGEGGKFLSEGAYAFGDTRAVMIEGPSREAIALVEVR